MTHNRRRKQDARAAAQNAGTRYTRALRATAPAASIRTYTGDIHLCTSCGQPAYRSPAHFTEQQSGIYCESYPAATGRLPMDWDAFSLDRVREEYPWPSVSKSTGDCTHSWHTGRFHTFIGQICVCTACGQPAYNGEAGNEHFTDQWDGIHCPWFPLAGTMAPLDWNPRSLAEWKAGYPCTYPH
ncbi:hypothetical protein [Streptomyces tauricus]|uniref:hypothetical protein n=1 Tax=Streptomyces tauricus TaxID=68274 RepID=UPI002244B1FE|nr:hypothetical protein [Streptomyces tauricus]MCW8097078.1 hypothetical protein [Streptomyces tauricus]